jgi:hypothetical protein
VNLVSRYVEQVKRYLPEASRQDTGKELESLIEDDLEAFTAELGRSPTDEEIAERLRHLGHPYKVAIGYRGNRTLISEKAYPLYRRMLASTLCTYLLVDVVLTLFVLANDTHPWGLQQIPHFFHSVADVMLFGFLLITAIFHYLGDQLTEVPFFWRFDPHKLPAVETRWANIPLTNTFVGIITTVVFVALLTASHFGYANADFSLQLAPPVVACILPLRVLVLVQLALHLLNMFQRYWTYTKLYIFIGASVLISLLLVRIIIAPHILLIHVISAATDVNAANHWTSWWPDLTLRVTLAIVAARSLYLSFKLLKSSRKALIPSV